MKVFVSSTTRGLQPYRSLVSDVLHAQGFEVKVEESFTTPEQPTIFELQEGLSRCDGIIALVGPYYGGESPVFDPESDTKLSYTQYELVFALHQPGKKLVLIAEPGSQAARDTWEGMPAESDEKRAQQAAFVERVRRLPQGLGCLPFRNREELALILAKTRWEAWRL